MSIRMRHTKGHRNNRRSHHALLGVKAVKGESGTLVLPHRVDESTGIYRGKQIAVVKAKKAHEPKVKGPATPAAQPDHHHEHAHEQHENAEAKGSRGIIGRLTGGGRPKARSGMGGQA